MLDVNVFFFITTASANIYTLSLHDALPISATVPGFSKLHLVIIVRSKASSRDVLGALQWRPEIAANAKPWLSLGAGEMLKIEMHDGYPAPTVPWEYEVFAHAYQYSSQ